jgi:hypothetical protein
MTLDENNKIIDELTQIVTTANDYIALFKKGENKEDILKKIRKSLNSKVGLHTLRELIEPIISEAPVEAPAEAQVEEATANKLLNSTEANKGLATVAKITNDAIAIRKARKAKKAKDTVAAKEAREAEEDIATQHFANTAGGKPKSNVKYISTKTKTNVKMKSGSVVSRIIYYKEGDKKKTKYVIINSEYVKYNK